MKNLKQLILLFFLILILTFSLKSQIEKKSTHFLLVDSSIQNRLDSLVNIGNSYYMLGQLNISIEYYNKAIKLNPNFAKAFFNRGNSNFDLGLKKEACEDWVTAIHLGQDEAEDSVIKYCK